MDCIDNYLTLHSAKAKELFLSGCNCSQAVFAAFGDITGIDNELALRISSPFGGGMGRMREVCGAFSAMLMVLGTLEGITDNQFPGEKKELYNKVQTLAEEFKKSNGSIICHELLGLPNEDKSATPSERNSEYYKKRPCADIVAQAASILDNYLAAHEDTSD